MKESKFTFSDYLSSSIDLDYLSSLNLPPQHHPNDICILGHVHCLPSLKYLIEALSNVGISPRKIYLIPKHYSTIPSAIDTLCELGVNIISDNITFKPGFYDESAMPLLESAIGIFIRLIENQQRLRRLIIVDDGGLLTASWWRVAEMRFRELEVISVQQTASGLSKRRLGRSRVPKIDVARSAAKRIFEAKIIVNGVLKKISSDARILQESHRVGIVGVGALGACLAQLIRDQGKEVWIYDRAHVPQISGVKVAESWRHCVRNCDTIFGCTGSNWLDAHHAVMPFLDSIRLISCSSRDVEFKNVLQQVSEKTSNYWETFSPLHCKMPNGAKYWVENWGFPINFDRSQEWEVEDEIALTRALVYGGILQALTTNAHSEAERVELLTPVIQRTIVETWLDWRGRTPETFGVSRDEFDSIDWWINNSASIVDEDGE